MQIVTMTKVVNYVGMTLCSEHGVEGDYELMELGDERDFELGHVAYELNRQVESPRSI